MKKFFSTAAKGADLFRRALLFFQRETGQSLAVWFFVALLGFVVQVIFRRELVPGAFGTMNAALGVVGLMTVPLLALDHAFTHYPDGSHTPEQQERLLSLRAAAPAMMQMAAIAWGISSIVVLCFLMPFLGFSGLLFHFFTILTVLVSLAGVTSAALYQGRSQECIWIRLVVTAAVARVILGASLARVEPWAESGIAVFLLAGGITAFPLLFLADKGLPWKKTWETSRDRDFLLYLGATSSVVLALFLFSSADRIVAQSWFGVANNNNLGWINWDILDSYQTAGLLGRGLLWGTQPLLLIFFAQRARLNRTTPASLKFFWIYLGALLLGTFLLMMLNEPLSRLFCGADFQTTSQLAPVFAMVMALLGFLQALGVFSLASRRYPECFVFGACSVGYAILLYNVGRHPQLMLAYMFGGALFSTMLVLFVGVVRWGRKQP